MPVPLRPPHYEGDPFGFEEFKLSARAFFEQSESTEELVLQQIRNRIKVKNMKYRQGQDRGKSDNIEFILNSVERCVYNPEYIRKWIIRKVGYSKGGKPSIRLLIDWAKQGILTRVETLRAVLFSKWFMDTARAAMPYREVVKFDASIEFLSRINPPPKGGRDLEEKGPHRSRYDQGHLQYGSDPRGLATPEGIAGGGDPEGIATPRVPLPGSPRKTWAPWTARFKGTGLG